MCHGILHAGLNPFVWTLTFDYLNTTPCRCCTTLIFLEQP